MPEGFEPGVSGTIQLHYETDEEHLASMGYKQEFSRNLSGFNNFAISFSIISILTGCFTTFSSGWNGGGPAAIAWGWPVLVGLIMCIGLCLAEMVSAYPTSGGLYWWASKLGNPKSGYYAGWLNLIGWMAFVASVAYGCATFLDLTLGFYFPSHHSGNLNTVFLYFLAVLLVATVVNIYSSQMLALVNNISVWWHVFGAAAVVLILIFVPEHHASASMVFTSTINNTGFFNGKTSGIGFLVVVLPVGALLVQYTVTGYDASAHMAEETKDAGTAAAKGMWRAILYAGIGGWILVLAFLFSVQDEAAVSKGGGGVAVIFAQALSSNWGGTVLLISVVGQFFCTMACMTACARLLFAFSRDGAVPGFHHWHKVNAKKVPVNGVILSAVVAVIITAPALIPVDVNGVPVPVAFYAVSSIGVIGIYWCFIIPIWHRLKLGSDFEAGKWNLGKKYKPLCIVAIADTVMVPFMAFMPTTDLGVPWVTGFSLEYVNYTILVVPFVMLLLWIYWHVSVKNWFTGPMTHTDVVDVEVSGTPVEVG